MDAAQSGMPKISWRQHCQLTKYILGLIYQKHKSYAIFFSITLIVSALIPAVSIWIGKLILDELALLIQSAGSMHRLLILVGSEVGIILVQRLLHDFTNYMSSRFSMLFSLDMRTILLNNNADISYHHFEQPSFYNKFFISSSHVVNSAGSYLSMLINLLRAVVQIVSITYILLKVDLWFLAAIVVINVISFLISIRIAKRQYKLIESTVSRERFVDYIYSLLTQLRTIRDIKLYDLFNKLITKFSHKAKKNIHLNLNFQRKEMKTLYGFELFTTVVYYSFYIYIVFQVANKILTLGDIVLFQRSYTTLDGALSSMSGSVTSLYENNLYLQKFYQLINDPQYKTCPDAIKLDEPITAIRLDAVRFCYPSRPHKTIITSCDALLEKGDLIAIVGNNGCGKSTLAKLLVGLFLPTEGNVFINNHATSQLDINNFHQRMSVMLQDYNQYDVSLQDNITCFDQNVNSAHLQSIIAMCQLDGLIAKLDGGLSAVLSRQFQDGVSLSAGQWQKIALARALYRSVDVLILDEPTAQLDVEFSHYFFSLLPQLQKQYQIVIVITHKLQYLRCFNKILYCNDVGRVAAGSYQTMVNENHYHLSMINQ